MSLIAKRFYESREGPNPIRLVPFLKRAIWSKAGSRERAAIPLQPQAAEQLPEKDTAKFLQDQN